MPEVDTKPDIDAGFTPEHLNAVSMDERMSDEMQAFSRRRLDDGVAHVTWWLRRTQESLDGEYTETETRQREYEPDYGND